MKKSDLRNLIREEIQKVLHEAKYWEHSRNRTNRIELEPNAPIQKLSKELDAFVKQGKLPKFKIEQEKVWRYVEKPTSKFVREPVPVLTFSGKDLEKEYPESPAILKQLRISEYPFYEFGPPKKDLTPAGKKLKSTFGKIYKYGDDGLDFLDGAMIDAKLDKKYDQWVKSLTGEAKPISSSDEPKLLQVMQDVLTDLIQL